MYLKIEPEAFEPTAKAEETQILDSVEAEEDLTGFTEKPDED